MRRVIGPAVGGGVRRLRLFAILRCFPNRFRLHKRKSAGLDQILESTNRELQTTLIRLDRAGKFRRLHHPITKCDRATRRERYHLDKLACRTGTTRSRTENTPS